MLVPVEPPPPAVGAERLAGRRAAPTVVFSRATQQYMQHHFGRAANTVLITARRVGRDRWTDLRAQRRAPPPSAAPAGRLYTDRGRR